MYKRFNSNGVIDTTFNVVTTSGNTYGEVIVPDYNGKILIGGDEHSINGKSPSGNFAKLNQDGTTSLCSDVSNAGSLHVDFIKRSSCGTQKTYINGILVNQLSSSGDFNGVLNTGDTFYVQIVSTGSACVNIEYIIRILSSTRGLIFDNISMGIYQSPTITRQNGEDFEVIVSSDL